MLTRWSWQIHTRLHEPRTTRVTHHGNNTSFNYGTITLYGQASTPIRLPASSTALHGSTTHAHPTTPTTQPLPGITRDRFSLIRVRSPLLTESPLFSLPAGTEMFHFPTFPPTGLYIQPAVTHKSKAMHAGFPHSDILASPFGYQLHQAYRRFPRPSSAPITKASTMRPYQLTQPTTPQNRAISRISHKLSKYNNHTKMVAITQIQSLQDRHTNPQQASMSNSQ